MSAEQAHAKEARELRRENDDLRAQRDELAEALKIAVDHMTTAHPAYFHARAALAKVKP